MSQLMTHAIPANATVQHVAAWQAIAAPKPPPPANAHHRSGATHTALWPLWEARQTYFHRLALRWMNGNQDDAAEAFNQAAFTIWQGAPAAERTVTNPIGWLTGLLRHTCLDLHRTRQRYGRHIESLDTEAAVAMVDECLAAPSSQSPEANVLLREKCAYVHAAVEALPATLRTPLILHCCHELGYEEIGVQLNLSPGNVRKRIQLARVALRNKLRAYQVGLTGPETDWPAAQQLFTYAADTAATATGACTDEAIQPRVTVLDQVSKREEQKLSTLRTYVQRHPTGWKKQLALADQLCKLGQQGEAVAVYQQVAAKQPRLLSVWLQIGRLCEEMGQVDEATAAFTQALALAKTDAQRADVAALQSALVIE